MPLFNRASQFSISGGVFTDAPNAQTVVNVVQRGPIRDGIDILRQYVAHSAIHNSIDRFDAPICAPETRIAVQENMVFWGSYFDAKDPIKLLWLLGAAGAGKSAIQQSVALRCAEQGGLAASFFFSYKDPSRDQAATLVPTLAYQLAQNISILRDPIGAAVEKDESIFEKDLDAQMDILILEPITRVSNENSSIAQGWPKTIIIDGLDECGCYRHQQTRTPLERPQNNTREIAQQKILQVLKDSAHCLPFRIMLASRAESPIREFFAGPAKLCTHLIDLNTDANADSDIRLYLQSRFNTIRLKYHLQPSWPSPRVIEELVDNASRQFIYAETVVRFVDDSSCQPEENLQLITDLRVDRSKAFSALDAMYTAIFRRCLDPGQSAMHLRLVVGLRYEWSSTRPPGAIVNTLLGLEPKDLHRVFGKLHSLIDVPDHQESSSTYALYHKALLDFLRDSARARDLFIPTHDLFEKLFCQYVLTYQALRCTYAPELSSEPSRPQELIFSQDTGNPLSENAPLTIVALLRRLSLRKHLPVSVQGLLRRPEVRDWIEDQISLENVFRASHLYVLVHHESFGCRRWKCGRLCKHLRKQIEASGAAYKWVQTRSSLGYNLWSRPVALGKDCPGGRILFRFSSRA
ncbi:hypothetical protein FA15DRAFT_692405 [Coprinopsis marcescibilis]|uniref:Nephrocystin 3-like N-terminal domain-containing protein n=1 Tax=Coprinopsis marcescibilis TaxID=230819 RepID=A0A5C3L3K1_COPMA|nr:hypothetical protein FA15DRAFT_692405 [Coprinopsis marcescibilis]